MYGSGRYSNIAETADRVDRERTGIITEEDVLKLQIPWEGNRSAMLISEEEYSLIRAYDKQPLDEQNRLLESEGERYAALFLTLIRKLVKDDVLQYILTLIDRLLSADGSRSQLFLQLSSEDEELPFAPFLRLLNRTTDDAPTVYITSKSLRILSLLMIACREPSTDDVQFLFRWCAEQLRLKDSPEEADIAVSALQLLLRKNEFRLVFYGEDGLKLLAAVLRNRNITLELTYKTIFCLWLMSFNETIAEYFGTVTGLIANIVEIIRREEMEKIRRISLAVLGNILNKADNNMQMLEAQLLKALRYLRADWGDEDIEENIEKLIDQLQVDMNYLSSWDVYSREVISGKLEWSPVHKSETFWRENVTRFEENKYKILGILFELVRSSKDPTVLAVACHDIGEFVRFHPRGRRIIGQLNGKVDIMLLMNNHDEKVQKHALLCVQKLMVTNWELLK